MDFETYTGKTENGLINGDLRLDSATHDLHQDDSDLGPVMASIRELFEMPPADDLSHPEHYSKQRSFMNGEGRIAALERVQDAHRLLKLIPEIDQKSVEITVNDDVMDLVFRLKSGSQGKVSL